MAASQCRECKGQSAKSKVDALPFALCSSPFAI
jgi:hypothetical protein